MFFSFLTQWSGLPCISMWKPVSCALLLLTLVYRGQGKSPTKAYIIHYQPKTFQTKVSRVFLLAIHLCCFDLRFLQTHATSYSFYSSVTVHCKGERGKPDRKPYPLSYCVRNPCRNLKSENSQDYAQRPQRNCTFMNSASGLVSFSFLYSLTPHMFSSGRDKIRRCIWKASGVLGWPKGADFHNCLYKHSLNQRDTNVHNHCSRSRDNEKQW